MLTPTCVHVKFSSGPYILNGITFDLKAYPPYMCILTNYVSERPRKVGTYFALCRFRSYPLAGQCKCHPSLPFMSLILVFVWTINTLYSSTLYSSRYSSTKARFGVYWARLINHTLDSFEVSLICLGKLRDKHKVYYDRFHWKRSSSNNSTTEYKEHSNQVLWFICGHWVL